MMVAAESRNWAFSDIPDSRSPNYHPGHGGPRKRSPKSPIGRLIARDGLLCHWCKNLCDPTLSSTADRYPTRDHLIRQADGGSNRLENLVLACRKCNNGRHSPGWKTLEAKP